MNKLVACQWHTGRSNIGIVVYQNAHEVFKAVMTTIQGFNVEEDLQHIMNYGSKISHSMAVEAILDGGTIEDITLWNEFKSQCPETRIVLDADNFNTLVTGGIVDKGTTKIILSDIGWDLMIDKITTAMNKTEEE